MAENILPLLNVLFLSLIFNFKATTGVREAYLHHVYKPCAIRAIPSQTYGASGLLCHARIVLLYHLWECIVVVPLTCH